MLFYNQKHAYLVQYNVKLSTKGISCAHFSNRNISCNFRTNDSSALDPLIPTPRWRRSWNITCGHSVRSRGILLYNTYILCRIYKQDKSRGISNFRRELITVSNECTPRQEQENNNVKRIRN